jgi:putative endonuclease
LGAFEASRPDGRARRKVYYIYILWFVRDGTKYIGYTENLLRRVREHLKGKGKYTSGKGEFKLIYVERYDNKQEAKGREKYLKSRSGRRYLATIL